LILGKKTIHYPVLDSTNDEARRLIRGGAGEGLVVVADAQTSGRGKPGFAWFSPPGNLYLSAVIKPYKNQRDLAPITLLAAVAARAASRLPLVIKWPNDLLLHGQKLGGILTERVPSGHLIIGIGINLNSQRQDFPGALRRTATSLRIATGKKIAVRQFTERLLAELNQAYRQFLAKR